MKHDYWIGDRVRIASLQQEGIFEGDDGENAIVKVNGEKQTFSFADISLVPEEDDFDPDTPDPRDVTPPPSRRDMPDMIDLHIEVLNPKLMHADPVLILAHQRVRLKDFLDRSTQHRISPIIIIHGKGEGVLKAMTLELLDDYNVTISALNEGVLEVRFK